MNTKQFAIIGCAAMILGVGTANAGPCNTRDKDAGSGPTPGYTGQSNITTGSTAGREHPPTETLNRVQGEKAASSQDAQKQMRNALPGVEMAIIVASMLHAIATGNLLPATVRTVVVDINPSVVTKLADRGSFQAAGLITDAELFLRELAEALNNQ